MLLSHSSQATCQKENVLPRCGEGCGIGPGKRGGHNTKPAVDHEGRPPARLLRLAFAHGSIGRNTAMRTISAGRRKPRLVPGSAAARPQATTTNNVPLVSSFVLRIAQQGNCRRRRRFPRGRRAEILEPNRACRVASAVPDQPSAQRPRLARKRPSDVGTSFGVSRTRRRAVARLGLPCIKLDEGA